ncbi:MAG: acetyl-CoA C-acyltransferase, partial [Candidatus Heimdallarchaeota archaeon]|nr:acetyl-CoA C-acyltransferase [Candidatus Heimdallarchaeota archaeon]
PIKAINIAVEKANWSLNDVDAFEINEAFAAQSIAVINELQIDQTKVNMHGGAIALGHPIGASGARCLVTLIYIMKQRKLKKGVVSLCVGGGMGVAMCIEMDN